MLKLPFLPKILLDVLGHIPTIAFKTINLPELMSKSKLVLKNMQEKEPLAPWLQNITPHLPASIKLLPELKKPLKPASGEDVLRLYFSQFKGTGPFFLDMRASHFSHDGNATLWCPSTLVYQFEADFQATLVNLYKGFYYEDNQLFWKSLVELGLTENLNEEQIETLMKLFKDNFGTNFRNYHFELDHFQESFAKIFEFFMLYKVKLKTDFLYLGLYLTTLFMHMDQFKESYNVEAIFLEVFPKQN